MKTMGQNPTSGMQFERFLASGGMDKRGGGMVVLDHREIHFRPGSDGF